MGKLTEKQIKQLAAVASMEFFGGSYPLDYTEYQAREALRRRRLLKRANKSRFWQRSFYSITAAGRRALEAEAGGVK